ncbi:hypothetical protein H2201_006904 [Coniosporium apollinis]|uniref:Stress-response A/B barrel domain-containing protein n=2 Tax=Coniosporium TaxID=2810619 RepID=A0ABQ9NKV3_9PEZI|nr:hypothetical protein H2199_005864 [Cladosporium sp. JES 115]KAJ9660482.1 hypothetical protein H2201_006904 [Coniosporium apollinis]
MPVYHIGLVLRQRAMQFNNYQLTANTALFKLKKGVDPAKVERWQMLAEGMVGQIPGLLDLRTAPPLEMTVKLSKGYDMAVVVLLDYVESLATFFTHHAHDEVNALYEEVCDKEYTLGYDIEF